MRADHVHAVVDAAFRGHASTWTRATLSPHWRAMTAADPWSGKCLKRSQISLSPQRQGEEVPAKGGQDSRWHRASRTAGMRDYGWHVVHRPGTWSPD